MTKLEKATKKLEKAIAASDEIYFRVQRELKEENRYIDGDENVLNLDAFRKFG